MRPGRDAVALLAAAAVALAVALGGAFAPGQRLAAAVLIAAVAGWFALAAARGPVAEEWLALAVIGWGSVSAALATGYPLAAKQQLGGFLVAWLVWVAVRRSGESWRRWCGLPLAAAAVVVAATVLAECAGAGRLRMGGLFVNPNVAAALLVPAVPALAAVLAPWGRRLTVVAMLLVAAGVVGTGSRAGLLALVVVIVLMLPRGRLRAVGVTAAVVAAGFFLAWRFAATPDALAWHRVEIWRALWPLVADAPLTGVGPGWLEEATGVVRIAHDGEIARWGHVIGSAESTPYGLLVRTGLIGLGLAVAAAVVWWRRVRCAGGWTATAAAVVAGIAVLALFHDLLDVDVVLWWWAALIGLAFPHAIPPVAGCPAGAGAGLLLRIPAALAMVFAVLWSVATPALARQLWRSGTSTAALAERAERAEPWFAEPLEWRVDELLARPRWSWQEAAEAISWSRRAVEVHPGGARAWSALGDVHARVAAELGPWPDALDGARQGFGRATALEPHLPWYWARWAAFERSVGQLEEARRLVDRALAEEPRFVRGWLFRARLALDRGDEAEARASFERARSSALEGRRRSLSDYERDLLRAPPWQVRELAAALAVPDREAAG
jgi:O-antigen ligase